MATFWSQPQPGDGSWLVDKPIAETQAFVGGRTRGRRRRKNNKSFLTTVGADSAGDPGGEVQTGRADAGGNTETFPQSEDNGIQKGAELSNSAQKVDIPRTSINKHSLLAAAAASTIAPAATAHHTTEHLLLDSANYTSQKLRDIDGHSQSSMGPKKFLPPHLARKVASSTDKTAPSAEANVTSLNGSTRDAAALPNRPKPTNAARGRGRGRGRGNGNGRGRSGGNSFAAARAEIPKADPNRWKTNWTIQDTQSSSSDYTGRASSGWGTKKKRAGQTANPPAADWSGKLAPPPPDWDSRPGFRVDQSYEKIMDWMGDIEHNLCGITNRGVPMKDVTAVDGTIFVFSLSNAQPDQPSTDLTVQQMGDFVPNYWVPIVVGKQAPQVFWNELLRSGAPPPDDPADLEGAKPWWEMFVKSEETEFHFLKELPPPTIIGIDPDQEDAEQKLKRKHDLGSKNSADNRRRYELERIQERGEKQRRLAEKRRILHVMSTSGDTTSSDHNRIKPSFKLLVRSARAEDMGAVKDIYNYYIENTTSVPEMERYSMEQMVVRYRDTRLRRMPFLVAYKPGVLVKAPRNKKNQTNNPTREDVQLPDTIVGFAFATDYRGSRGMYQFTAKMEFYTKETEYMNGVASCLVDRLLVLFDPTYQERGGYGVMGEDIDGLEHVRIIKNIIVELPYEKPERLEWMGKWLEESLKFKEVGLLEKIATKNGKAVSLAIFQRETGANLDHANPPSGLVET